MDMSKYFRPESHVAQQSRRDKLRFQQSSNSIQHLEDFPCGLEQASAVHPGLNPDIFQVRNVRSANLLYDPALVSPSVIHLSTNSSVLPTQRDAMLHRDLQTGRHVTVEDSSFAGMSHSVLSSFNASSKVTVDPQSCGNWKSIDSQQNCDWMASSYASGSAVGRESNQNSMFAAQVLSNNARQSNMSATATTQYLKPNFDSYHHHQDVHSTSTNPCSEISNNQDSKKRYGTHDLHFASPSLYQNSVLQDVVTTVSVAAQALEGDSLQQQNNIREAARSSWAAYSGNNQSGSFLFGNAVASHDATTQGLSLSLSSNPPPNKSCVPQFGEEYGTVSLYSRPGELKESQDSETVKSAARVCSVEKPSVSNKGHGKSLQDTAGTSNYIHRHTGPLGPFTGYATILKNSRFLKPAQELLDDFSNTNTKLVKSCKITEGTSGEISASAEAPNNAADMETRAKGNNSVASSSTFYSSNQSSGGDVDVGRSSGEPYRPEYQQKKAKLLYLQEEVCRRYKLYNQQMQMVVSSFESVPGLSAATPYITLALRTITRNFRCLKNAISDQIKLISRALGEDFLSPAAGTSSSKSEINMSKLKYVGQKSGGVNVGYLEPQQHGWRPQRGLPERSVAILKAWLFEHFLHPYPTDTDKHMLATQTGLSRNQVSNWFINARVRVWKPMVEEIHMLESKGLGEANQLNPSKNDGKAANEGTSRTNEDEPLNKPCINVLSDKHLGCLKIRHGGGNAGEASSAEQWNQEKRSRVDFHVPTSMDGSLIGFIPYQRSGLEMGGVGAVSLTLGLRHGVESARQQQQQQLHQHEDQLRRAAIWWSNDS